MKSHPDTRIRSILIEPFILYIFTQLPNTTLAVLHCTLFIQTPSLEHTHDDTRTNRHKYGALKR
jgi:hypothetical protein